MNYNKTIYVAGPLFSESERRYLEYLVDFLQKELDERLHSNKQDYFFLPHRDVGDAGIVTGGNEDVFASDLRALDKASIVVAWLDGSDVDSGTAVELGYAYAKGKHIFGILTDRRRWSGSKIKGLNNMVWGLCQGEDRIYKVNETEEKKRLSEDILNALKR